MNLNINGEDFIITKGENASHVEYLNKLKQESWFSFLPWKEKSINISPFNFSCVGVYTKHSYKIKLDLRGKNVVCKHSKYQYRYTMCVCNICIILELNFNRFLTFGAGIVLFFFAPTLCEKAAFHYTTGTLIGVLGSILIVVYLTSRLIPKVIPSCINCI